MTIAMAAVVLSSPACTGGDDATPDQTRRHELPRRVERRLIDQKETLRSQILRVLVGGSAARSDDHLERLLTKLAKLDERLTP